MTRTKTTILLIIVILIAAWTLWPRSSAVDVNKGPGDMSKLVNRVWIDAIPTNERDMVDVFLMIDEANFGVFSKNSAYQGDWSAFEWTNERGLRLHMLQSDKTYKVQAKVMSKARCAPFDHCLQLKGNPRGSKRYGSMEDWVITSDAELNPPSLVRELFFP